MDAGYARHYRDLYERHWWWRAREAALLEILTALKPPSGWPRILDIGCGDGLFFDRLREFGEVEGVEPSRDLVDPSGPHRSRIHVCSFDARFRPATRYSLILMLDVLEHLDDPVAALRHAIELLAPDGVMVITVPAFNLLWTNHDTINHHRVRYTRASFRAVAEQTRLRIDREEYWFQWTFAAKLAARLVERISRREPTVPRIPPAWLNAVLYKVSRLERRLLSPLHPAFGTSLVVIGGARNGQLRETSLERRSP